MEHFLSQLILLIVLAPLIGCAIAGLFCRVIPKALAHWVTILGVGISFVSSIYVFNAVVMNDFPPFEFVAYVWGESGAFAFDVAFMVDQLTATMMLTVTFVSLLVHIYSIGYMAEDTGYQRFFSYMSLFTFAMLMLVGANNFFQLFFGWEGVGLASYLLIGFWFKKESAVQGSLKAFLVNRVGDFAFLLGIAGILDYFGTLNYTEIFQQAPAFAGTTIDILPNQHWLLPTVIGVLLFIGAMGKSAQIPLHVWLPESMEGPTPISALIHAATMVTAGVFMVARLAPLYELSNVALALVMIIGALTALLTGFIAIVQTDIKRVIAYSTMSQLGYMMAANGASAYAAGIFHLITHACFKSILFLAAGSVIVAMHHKNQDMRSMGNLKKYMPITYFSFLVGALALAAIPPFSGFYSKDAIIEAVHLSTVPGASFAYVCLLVATFVTALYIFRALFLTFHGEERIPESVKRGLRESRAVITVPLIILAIPSMIIGAILVQPMLYASPGMLGRTVEASAPHDVLTDMAAHFPGVWAAIGYGLTALPFWLAVLGIGIAWLCYIQFPEWPQKIRTQLGWLYSICEHKFGFDAFNDLVFVRGGQWLASFLFNVADLKLLDGLIVLGSGHTVVRLSQWSRRLQSGYLYHYAFAMILGLFIFLCWLLLFRG